MTKLEPPASGDPCRERPSGTETGRTSLPRPTGKATKQALQRPLAFAALRGDAAREYLLRHQGSDRTREEYIKALGRFETLLRDAGYKGDRNHVCEASMEAALAEMAGARIRANGVAQMVKPGTLSTFAGRVKRGAEMRSALGSTSWRVTELPGGNQLGRAAMAGYQQLYDGAVKEGAIEEPFPTNEARALKACDILALWNATASDTERLLVRALSLTRVLLTRPSEILRQRAPSARDIERYTKAGLHGTRKDGEGFPFIIIPGYHSKVAGRQHLALIWSDPATETPQGCSTLWSAGIS